MRIFGFRCSIKHRKNLVCGNFDHLNREISSPGPDVAISVAYQPETNDIDLMIVDADWRHVCITSNLQCFHPAIGGFGLWMQKPLLDVMCMRDTSMPLPRGLGELDVTALP